jgi:hypothetical protein
MPIMIVYLSNQVKGSLTQLWLHELVQAGANFGMNNLPSYMNWGTLGLTFQVRYQFWVLAKKIAPVPSRG